jgi:hypothetical protein
LTDDNQQQQRQRRRNSERLSAESDLYAPVKRFLQARGLEAKGEVRGCDVVAVSLAEPDLPVVVELKRAVTLAGVLQCVDRFAVTDLVYLAVPAAALPRPKSGGEGFRRLCRRLGLGLLAVDADGAVSALSEPLPARTPRRNRLRAARVLAEHARRRGDPTPGGRPGGVRQMTAYRQRALRCAAVLHGAPGGGPLPVRAVREAAAAPDAGRILYRNVYGWFEPAGRDLYRLTEMGVRELAALGPAAEVDIGAALPSPPVVAKGAAARTVSAP